MIFDVGPTDIGGAGAWACLATLHADTVVLGGSDSNLPQPWFELQAEQAGAPFVSVEGGHFFVQEDTGQAVALVHQHLGG
jgi:hypothetical protein